ncbi:MAG TPA: sigma-70 family RNA polymerase sigma factor, partial [Solirubrobacter sp.]|nr:sigma-70 family RNA polymerase sigma factor [Solirubrobacter sp.]
MVHKRFATQVQRRGGDGDDLISAGITAALESLLRYDPQSGKPLRGWLYNAARYGVLGELRRTGRGPTNDPNRYAFVSLNAENPSMEGHHASIDLLADPEVMEDRVLISDALTEAMRDLSDDARTAVLMACVDGYSHREIAKSLGRTPVAIT